MEPEVRDQKSEKHFGLRISNLLKERGKPQRTHRTHRTQNNELTADTEHAEFEGFLKKKTLFSATSASPRCNV